MAGVVEPVEAEAVRDPVVADLSDRAPVTEVVEAAAEAVVVLVSFEIISRTFFLVRRKRLNAPIVPNSHHRFHDFPVVSQKFFVSIPLSSQDVEDMRIERE